MKISTFGGIIARTMVFVLLLAAGCDSGSDDNANTSSAVSSESSSGGGGFASTGTYDPSAPANANVTVYNRSYNYGLTAYIDGYLLGSVSPNSYQSWKVSSGQYFVQANMANGTSPYVGVNIQPAEDEYVFVYEDGAPQIRLTPR